VGLYGLKPAFTHWLGPIVDRLVARRVSPDLISALAVIVAALGGACLALAPWATYLFLAVPFLAALRLVLNILDGAVARQTEVARPMGELWNELGDRVADILFIGGLAFHPAVDTRLVLAAVSAALLASYAGVAARAAGGARQYTGIMSKPGRMVVLALAAPLAWLTLDTRWLDAGLAMIAIGAVITLGQRVYAARRELAGAE
jgi:phosphatidylglycerophosphate synthase